MEKQFINPENLYHLPAYTQIVGVTGGTTYYFAGIVAFDKDINTVDKGDLAAQLEKVCQNLEVALQSINADFADVVKMTIYVVDYQPKFREVVLGVLGQYLSTTTPPAMTLLGVQALARPELLVEIEATVVVE